MTKPFKKIDRQLDEQEKKDYLDKTQDISAKHKEIAQMKKDMEQATDETKFALAKELKSIEQEKNKAEGELLKYKTWIEVDMGTHVREMIESDQSLSENLKYAFVQNILENPDPEKKEFYTRAYEEFNNEISGNKETASDNIFMLQMLLVECHEQMNTLQGFKLKDVQYGKLNKFYDGILGGRTLRAMWNVAFEDYKGFPSSDSANFTDPIYMKRFLDKVVSICGGNVKEGYEKSVKRDDDKEEKKKLSTTPLDVIKVNNIEDFGKNGEEWNEMIAGLFDENIEIEDINNEKKSQAEMRADSKADAKQRRAGRKSNILHSIGGTLDPINPETVWRMEAAPAVNLKYAEHRAEKFLKLFVSAGSENREKYFNKQELMSKFFQIIKDYMRLTKIRKNGKVAGLSFRNIQKNIFRLTVFKTILGNQDVREFMGDLDLQSTENSYAGGSAGLEKWKEFLGHDMKHEGGITPKLIDTMMEKFQTVGKL